MNDRAYNPVRFGIWLAFALSVLVGIITRVILQLEVL